MKKAILFAAVGFALASPAGALASGVVLKVQPSRHLVAVAQNATTVKLVHTAAASRLHVGQRVDVKARNLRNGTLAASKITVRGHASRVRFRGLLLANSHGTLVVSAGGAVITVHGHPRTTASARDTTPAPGTTVDVTATVGSDDELEEDDVSVFSPTSPGGSIEGQLLIGAGTITITSEHQSLVIAVPAAFDLTPFTNGQDVFATFSQQSNGSLLLTKLSGDENAQQANDQNENQDDDQNDDGGGGDGGGGGGGGDGGGGD
jgi:uncharacterized membrane protein YgcG